MNSKHLQQEQPTSVLPSPTPHPEPPHHKPIKIIIVAILLALTVIVGVVAYQTMKTPKPVEMEPMPATENHSSPTPVAMDMSDWQTYIDESDNYSVQYPPDWYIYPAQESGEGTAVTDTDISQLEHVPSPNDMNHVRLNMGMFYAKPAETSLEVWLTNMEKTDPDMINETIYEKELVDFNGYHTIRKVESVSEFLQLGLIDQATRYYIDRGDKVFRITIFPASSIHQYTVDQILSTFRFLDGNNTRVGESCKIGGCNGELCLNEESEDFSTICVINPAHICLKDAVCEKQSNNSCGWIMDEEVALCIQNAEEK